MSTLPIGVFDSGIGGLTVLRALRERLPQENFIYLGDTARLPYGTKSPETIIRYARQASSLLVERGIKLLVVACNTASAHAIPVLQSGNMPVLGVIEPGAAAALAATRNRRIAVLATESTVAVGAYAKAIHALDNTVAVEQCACSLLVALAEEGWTDGIEAESIIRRYLTPLLKSHQPDTLVLGCTHFPLLIPALRKVAGEEVAIVDSASTAANAVEKLLIEHKLKGQGHGQLRFMATDGAARFARVAGQFLGRAVAASDVEIVNL
jgi:glutamate racemase